MSDTTKTGTVVTVKIAAQCRKEFDAIGTPEAREAFKAWLLKHKDGVGYRKLGQMVAYDQSPRKMAG